MDQLKIDQELIEDIKDIYIEKQENCILNIVDKCMIIYKWLVLFMKIVKKLKLKNLKNAFNFKNIWCLQN